MGESWRDMALRLNDEKSWGGKGTQQLQHQQQNNWQGKGKGQAKGKGKGQEASTKSKGKDSGKGKGQDAGKSKGKGKGACWPCPDKRCATMVGKVWMNTQALDQCSQCGTWKVAKEAPDTDWLARREELRAKIAAEGAAETPKEVDEEMGNSEDEKEEAESILELTDEFKELESYLKMPNDLKPGWDPALALEAGAASPGQAASQRTKEIEACKKFLALEPMAAALGQGKEEFVKTRTKLAALEKAAMKAEKDAPGAKLTACQLATARQATERQERMEEICTEQANAWMDQMRAIQKQKLVREEAWNVRKAVLEDRRDQVVELIDQKIKAAEDLAASLKDVKAPGAASPAETPEQKKDREKEEKAEKEKAAKEAKEEKERLAAAQAEADRQAAAQAEAKRAFGRLQTTATVAKSDLADLSKRKATDESTKVMATMYYWARASAMGDQALPFSFAEMGATVEVALELVGKAVWKAFFSECVIVDKDVCPMQLRQIMFLQLMILDADLREKVNADQEAVALKHLEDAEPRLKRLRTMLNGAA